MSRSWQHTLLIFYPCAHIQDILEDLFLGAGVDLVLTGHVHLYARTCSVAAERCVDDDDDDDGGITHITLGEPCHPETLKPQPFSG